MIFSGAKARGLLRQAHGGIKFVVNIAVYPELIGSKMQEPSQRQERLTPAEVTARIVQIVSQQETTKYCTKCQKHVLALRPGTSRLRQMLLTIITLGLWSVVWIADAVRRPGWRCSECDQRVG